MKKEKYRCVIIDFKEIGDYLWVYYFFFDGYQYKMNIPMRRSDAWINCKCIIDDLIYKKELLDYNL